MSTHGATSDGRAVEHADPKEPMPGSAHPICARTPSRAFIHRYRIDRLLGTGGCAEAFAAYDEARQREVALKRLRRDAGRLQKDLFEREFHTLAQLAHPRIIEVYDYGVDSQGPYYTMELLAPLDVSNGSALPWQEVCADLRDVASSLALIHARRLLHRDVTPRNVCRAADGRAKLIDFGALVSFGRPKGVVGTPPCVPPEALHRHELDARADLFGLGATAYCLLTGRHAYPARTLRELTNAWRSTPPAPHVLDPSIPRELSDLVMALLCLDRRGRPGYAAEVTERLAAIADLEPEPYELGQAYLTTPTLVGRDSQLACVRDRLLALRRGQPGALVATGPSAIGRTRFVDHCALEAKLLGVNVVQHSSEEGRDDYQGIGQLAEELMAIAPTALEAARAQADLLAYAIPSLRGPTWSTDQLAARERLRPKVQQALCDWLLAASRDRRPLVVVIDDFHLLDEPSAAVLAGLARRANDGRLLLICSLPDRARETPTPLVEALAEAATTVPLDALNRDQTHALVGACFGEVPCVHTLAERLHEVSRGNPGVCAALARHLVDRGLVRFERGTWILPERIENLSLPESLEDALRCTLSELSPAALELLYGLALSTTPLDLPDYRHLLGGSGAPERVFDALHELERRGLLMASGDAFVLPQEVRALVVRAHDPLLSRAAHASLARLLLGARAHPASVLHHELRGGLESAGIDRLIALIGAYGDGSARLDAERARALPEDAELALELCQTLERPRADSFRLAQFMALLSYHVDPTLALRHGPIVEDRLRCQLGVVYWDELSADATDEQRVQHGLRRAQEVYDGLPEHERELHPAEALHALGRYAMITTGPYALMLEVEALQRLQRLLSPFAHLSPLLELVLVVVRASEALDSGRSEEAGRHYRRALDLVDAPGSAVTPEVKRAFRQGILVGLAHVHAPYADPVLLHWADELESSRAQQANAWRLRRFYHLFRGDVRETRRCTERIERVSLQNGGLRTSDGGTVFMDMLAARLSGDLTLFSEVLERIESVADRFPNQVPTRHYARGVYQALRGDHAAAKRHLETALAMIDSSHTVWAATVEEYGQTLLATGEVAKASEHLMRAVILARRSGLEDAKVGALRQLVARCEIESGAIVEGLAHMKEAVEACEHRGEAPIARGRAYERAARAAAVAGDRDGFEHYASALKEICKASRNPSLTERYNALAAIPLSGLSLPPACPAVQPRNDFSEALTLLTESGDRAERARRALQLLTNHCAASGGLLYRVQGSGLELAASSLEEPGGLREEALRYYQWATSTRAQATQTSTEATLEAGQLVCEEYQPVVLAWGKTGRVSVSGIAMLRSTESRFVAPDLLASVARAMADHVG